MQKFVKFGVLTVFGAVLTLSARENMLNCEVLDDGAEKIQCTFVTPRNNNDREAVFYWYSDAFPQDDREHMIVLRASNGSVYDYRFLRGRAEGMWTVTVTLTDTDGSEREVSHRFTLEGGALVEPRAKK